MVWEVIGRGIRGFRMVRLRVTVVGMRGCRLVEITI